MSISALLRTFIHGIDLVLVENSAVEPKSSIVHKLYIALTSFLFDSYTSKYMSYMSRFDAWY